MNLNHTEPRTPLGDDADEVIVRGPGGAHRPAPGGQEASGAAREGIAPGGTEEVSGCRVNDRRRALQPNGRAGTTEHDGVGGVVIQRRRRRECDGRIHIRASRRGDGAQTSPVRPRGDEGQADRCHHVSSEGPTRGARAEDHRGLLQAGGIVGVRVRRIVRRGCHQRRRVRQGRGAARAAVSHRRGGGSQRHVLRLRPNRLRQDAHHVRVLRTDREGPGGWVRGERSEHEGQLLRHIRR